MGSDYIKTQPNLLPHAALRVDGTIWSQHNFWLSPEEDLELLSRNQQGCPYADIALCPGCTINRHHSGWILPVGWDWDATRTQILIPALWSRQPPQPDYLQWFKTKCSRCTCLWGVVSLNSSLTSTGVYPRCSWEGGSSVCSEWEEMISREWRNCEKLLQIRKEQMFIHNLLNPWSHGFFLLCSSAFPESCPFQKEDDMMKFQVS